MTSSGWKPSKAYSPDPNAGWDRLVAHPKGTSPKDAGNAFFNDILQRVGVFVLAPGIGPEIERHLIGASAKLHTSTIGSFRLIATVDSVIFKTKGHCDATINVWMYNEMSKRSFGKFADRRPAKWTQMKLQFMWWNWKEEIKFDSNGKLSDDNN